MSPHLRQLYAYPNSEKCMEGSETSHELEQNSFKNMYTSAALRNKRLS